MLISTKVAKSGAVPVLPTNKGTSCTIASAYASILVASDIMRGAVLMAEHVLGAALPSLDIVSGPIETLNGATIELAVSDADAITVNDTKVTGADMAVSNGIVHVINTVLLPPTDQPHGSRGNSDPGGAGQPRGCCRSPPHRSCTCQVDANPSRSIASSSSSTHPLIPTNSTSAAVSPRSPPPVRRIVASNSIVHIINMVLLPPTATNPAALVDPRMPLWSAPPKLRLWSLRCRARPWR